MELEELIREHFDELSQTEWEIWDYIWQNRQLCEHITITELAKNTNVSPGAITRFMKKIGLEGFTEFKIALRWQNREKPYIPLDIKTRLNTSYQETQDLIANLDTSEVYEMLHRAKRVFVFGTGEVQRHAALEFKRMFTHVGQQTVYMIDSLREFDNLKHMVGPDDVLIAISMSGENALANAKIRELKDCGVGLISITAKGDNSLMRMSDFHFPYAYSTIIHTPKNHRDHHTSSMVFFVVETMFIDYLQYLHAVESL